MEKLNIALTILENRLSLGAGNGVLWLCLMGGLVIASLWALGRGRR